LAGAAVVTPNLPEPNPLTLPTQKTTSKGQPVQPVRSMLSQLLSNPPDIGGRNEWLTKVAGHYAKEWHWAEDLYLQHCDIALGMMAVPLEYDESQRTITSIWTTEHEDDDNDEAAVAIDGYRLTDVGNSERLIAIADGKLRYVNAWGRWLVYRGGRWQRDNNSALVTELAKKVAKTLFAQVGKVSDKKEREALFKWAKHSEATGAIQGMIHLARGNPTIALEHEELDADPYLLNVKNGTVDLRTGDLGPHDPADLCSFQVAISYDPKALAPLWDNCLETWQPSLDIRAYLQLEAGAGATGDATETLSVHHGGGGNGKTKFWGAVQYVLGEYAVAATQEPDDRQKTRATRHRTCCALSETARCRIRDKRDVHTRRGAGESHHRGRPDGRPQDARRPVGV